MLSANQKQQTTLGIVMKGKQDKTQNIIMALYKSTVHLPLGDFLQFWSISEAQKSRRVGQGTAITSVRVVSNLVKAPQTDQEMMRWLRLKSPPVALREWMGIACVMSLPIQGPEDTK